MIGSAIIFYINILGLVIKDLGSRKGCTVIGVGSLLVHPLKMLHEMN